MAKPLAPRGLALLCGVLLALTSLLPAPHPEARLLSEGWGSSSFIDPNLCIDASSGQAPRMTLIPRAPAVADWQDRLALLANYALWGLLMPVLALAALFRIGRQPFGTSSAAFVAVGLLGIAPAWFQWTLNPAFVSLRQALGVWLVERRSPGDNLLPLIDATALLTWLAGGALLCGGATFCATWAAARLVRLDWRLLAHDLIPLAGVTLLLGLTMDGALYLRGEGANLDWLPGLRASLLTLAAGSSVRLGWRRMQRVGAGETANRVLAGLLWLLPAALVALNGWLMFFHWTSRYHV